MSRNEPAAQIMPAAPQYYFEDFPPGLVIETPAVTFSAGEIIEFASRYDPQVFHTDPDRARQSAFGGLIASGWHTASIAMRLICDTYLLKAASIGSPGVKDLRWLKPVRPGDAMRIRMTVEESRPSSSKPDRGAVTHRWEGFNQHGEKVLEMHGVGLFFRRPAPAAGGAGTPLPAAPAGSRT